jgi:hypothetical protein
MTSCEIYITIHIPELCDSLWLQYKETHLPLRDVTGQVQDSFSMEEFLHMLQDTDYIKFVVPRGDTIVGFSTLCPNLDKAARKAHANPEKIRNTLPDFSGRVYYINVLYVTENSRSGQCFVQLISSMMKYVFEHRGAVAFDYSSNANSWLPDGISFVARKIQEQVGKKVKGLAVVELDRQCYVAIKPELF